MPENITIHSPSDNHVVAQRSLASDSSIRQSITHAQLAQAPWQQMPVKVRATYCLKAIEWFMDNQNEIALEISQQMGRPIQYAAGEIAGMQERALHMIDIANDSLKDIKVEDKVGFTRFIRPTPLGTVFVIAPWNYPYLTAINAIIPALMAGNTVILKHSAQTLLCAERFSQAFEAAGLPAGIFQFLHLSHDQTAQLVQHKAINFVSFTGSVNGGKAIEQASAGHFKPVALELGGKDAAYVRHDADVNYAAENLVDGSFFNSGQSCCGIERIYVHDAVYDEFLQKFIELTKQYTLGSALNKATTLGPMINTKAANFAREQIQQAKEQGAVCHINESDFPLSKKDTPYLAPQVLTQVDHSMSIMNEESFAPVVGIMSVASDEQALDLINDSDYGLTTSLWTQDTKNALYLVDYIQSGTVFMNRCDYLDPALAWVGIKNSGRGCALSPLAYQQFTRPKSIHIKHLEQQ